MVKNAEVLWFQNVPDWLVPAGGDWWAKIAVWPCQSGGRRWSCVAIRAFTIHGRLFENSIAARRLPVQSGVSPPASVVVDSLAWSVEELS